jgi:hypothetical protein
MMQKMREAINRGDRTAMRLYAEMNGLVKSGVSVTTNVGSNNKTTNNTAVIAGPGFDAIVRNLDEKRKIARSSEVLTIEAVPQRDSESQ